MLSMLSISCANEDCFTYTKGYSIRWDRGAWSDAFAAPFWCANALRRTTGERMAGRPLKSDSN
jgi:hypothetical protein